MTEMEWLNWSGDAEEMLLFYCDEFDFSERKERLLAVACCRRVWRLIRDSDVRSAIQLSEEVADGAVPFESLKTLEGALTWEPRWNPDDWASFVDHLIAEAVRACLSRLAIHRVLQETTKAVGLCHLIASHPEWQTRQINDLNELYANRDSEREACEQCALVREVLGNPFRPVVINPSWVASNGGAVKRLAAGIYEEKTFGRMPILADALEDAGCDHAEILEHCRGPGLHVRGCWVLDLILGKE
jgi:hypothetical protein